MGGLLLFMYGLYLLIVGVRGKAGDLLTQIEHEKQFVYWMVILLVLAALWETEEGEEIAKPFAALVVVGFLLKNDNWQTIAKNLTEILPSNSPGG